MRKHKPSRFVCYDDYHSRMKTYLEMIDKFREGANEFKRRDVKAMNVALSNADTEHKPLNRELFRIKDNRRKELNVLAKITRQQRKAAMQLLLEREKYEQTQEILNSRRYFRPPYPPRDSLAPVPGLPRLDSLYHVQYVRPHETPQPYAPPPPPPVYNVREPAILHRHWETKAKASSRMIKNPQLHIDGLRKIFPNYKGLTVMERVEIERQERRDMAARQEADKAAAKRREEERNSRHVPRERGRSRFLSASSTMLLAMKGTGKAPRGQQTKKPSL